MAGGIEELVVSLISVMEHDCVVTEAKRPTLGEAIKQSSLVMNEGYERQVGWADSLRGGVTRAIRGWPGSATGPEQLARFHFNSNEEADSSTEWCIPRHRAGVYGLLSDYDSGPNQMDEERFCRGWLHIPRTEPRKHVKDRSEC